MSIAERAASLRRQWFWLRFAGPLILLLLTIGFFWKLVLTDQYTWLDHPDMVNQVLPWYQFQARELHRGALPLWDPYHWAGQPLPGQLQPGACYPLNWLLYSLPLRDTGFLNLNWLEWYFIGIHFMGCLFCYWLCRDLKRSVAASVLAGLVFGLGGYVGTNNWPQMINGAVWAPLVFLFLLRALRGERPVASAALAGAFLGVAYLSGHHQIPIYMTLAAGFVWIGALVQESSSRFRILRLALVFGIFMALTGALQTLPGLEFGRHAVRWVGGPQPVGWGEKVPYFVHDLYSMGPEFTVGLIFRNFYRSANANQFLGVVAISFAVLAIAAAWRERMVRLFVAVSLGALLMALGSNFFGHGLLYALVPMVEKARNPSMAIALFHFAAAVLVAFGADAWRDPAIRGADFSRKSVRLLTAFSALLFAFFVAARTVRPPTSEEYEALGIAALSAGLLAALLHGWRAGAFSTRLALPLTGLLLLTELGNVVGYNYQRRDKPESGLRTLAAFDDLARFLHDQSDLVRVEIDGSAIPFNFGDWYGIEQLNGYLASMTSGTRFLMRDYDRLRTLLGASHYIGRKPSREGQTEIFTHSSGLKVYRDPRALPAVWTVHEVRGVGDQFEAWRAYQAIDPDLRTATFVKGAAPELELCEEPENVQVAAREPSFVAIEARMACRGMVVLSDTMYPGWKATVDGREAEIYDAYGALRGVVVGSGSHTVEFRYRPGSVHLGALLTVIGILSAAALQIAPRFQRRIR